MNGHNGKSPRRVLVIRIGRLGDTVLATPVVEVLQGIYGGGVTIDFAASPGASTAILELDRRINRVYAIDRRRLPWRLHPVKRALRIESRSNPYDLVINLECGTECDDFHDFVETREFCGRPLAQPEHSPGRHCVDTEKSIYAERLDPALTEAAGPVLRLRAERKLRPEFGKSGHVVLNPGFSGVLKTGHRRHRAWPLDHWAGLIELIREKTGLAVVINGTEAERAYFAPLLALPAVHSLFGSSLETLIGVLSTAGCLVSVDTGTMHLATALGTPVVALFGPTNPELTGPYSKKTECAVLQSGIDCQPCFRTRDEKRCTLNRCMRELTPQTVFESLERLALTPNQLVPNGKSGPLCS